MSTSQNTIEFLLDQLGDARAFTTRKMFGEYCLYYLGRPVGLVCDNQLFLKPTDAGVAALERVEYGHPYPGARPHIRLTADAWEDGPRLMEIVRTTAMDLPAAKPPRPRAAKKSTAKPPAGVADKASIDALPNLGPKSKIMLAEAGIGSIAALRKLGAVAAYVKVRQKSPRASLNLLWALEGALTGIHWTVVAKEHRTSLLLALEQYQRPARKK
jgi:DNA transformation protein